MVGFLLLFRFMEIITNLNFSNPSNEMKLLHNLKEVKFSSSLNLDKELIKEDNRLCKKSCRD